MFGKPKRQFHFNLRIFIHGTKYFQIVFNQYFFCFIFLLFLLPNMFVVVLNAIFPTEFERSAKMTWFDFISSFSGICGLCLGISFVSVTEILYWFSIRLCKNF